jgi:hypothetical protein
MQEETKPALVNLITEIQGAIDAACSAEGAGAPSSDQYAAVRKALDEAVRIVADIEPDEKTRQ